MSTPWQQYEPGIGHVGSYQVSGHPYMTGSLIGPLATKKVEFPHVTKSITVSQSGSGGGKCRITFVPTGSSTSVFGTHHYWELNSQEDALTMNVKCREIYITNGHATAQTGFQLFAELTRIDPNRMFALTGSGITDP